MNNAATTPDKNAEILKTRLAAYNNKPGARVGDYLILPFNQGYTRFTHDWTTSLQTGGEGGGSYYLGNGYLSYSGGLNPGVAVSDLEATTEVKKGYIWFFKNDHTKIDNSITYQIDQRVFKLKDGAELKGLFLPKLISINNGRPLNLDFFVKSNQGDESNLNEHTIIQLYGLGVNQSIVPSEGILEGMTVLRLC